jgi:hypothetical protein
MEKLHEDSPTLRTEGGDPGTENAGVVAFLRERLVDLDDDDETHDLEALNMGYGKEPKEGTPRTIPQDYSMGYNGVFSDSDSTIQNVQIAKNGEPTSDFNSGYYLDEIQPMDMDLGVGPQRG